MVALSPGFIHEVLAFPARSVWTDYDAEADVLYISFRKPQAANDTVMEADGNLYHYRDEQLVGITVMNASQAQAQPQAAPPR